jgi:ketosteroid isomerase-like protein
MPGMVTPVRSIGFWLLLGGALSVAPFIARAQQPRQAPAIAQAQQARQAPSEETLHNELRALKDRAVAAVNKRDPDALMKELHPKIAFTAMNNEVVHGIDEAKAYYQKMLVGAARIVEDMSLTAEPDRPADIYANGTMAVATGTSNAHFKLSAGPEFDVPLRWTATLQRTNDKWAIAGMHFSANMFDNPTLSALERFIKWIAIGTAVVALLVGFFAGRWSRRRSA